MSVLNACRKTVYTQMLLSTFIVKKEIELRFYIGRNSLQISECRVSFARSQTVMLILLALRAATRTAFSLGISNGFYGVLSLSDLSLHFKSSYSLLMPLFVFAVWLAEPTCYFSSGLFRSFCICVE